MPKLTLITVGTVKEAYLREAIAEYAKRIGAYAKVEIVELKEETIKNEDDRAQISRALAAEGEKILAAVPEGAYTIALCVEGKQYDSPALAEILGKAGDASGKIALIIGSSHGLAPAVKDSADLHLSVSKMTFPHQLMRVILLEAVYRSYTILAGKKYHK